MKPQILWLLARMVSRFWEAQNGKVRQRQYNFDRAANRTWFLRKT